MTVYIVLSGEYDASIVKVFADSKDAYIYSEMINGVVEEREVIE